MTTRNKMFAKINNIILGLIAFILSSSALYAQIPKGVPHPDDNEPLSTTTEVLFYIIIPVVLLIIYFIWRRQVKKKSQKESQDKEERDMEDNPEK